MPKIKLQIKSVLGSVLFEYEKENNTLKDTLSEAIKRSADLRSADLRSADLRSANLRSANLRSANLRSANLRSADLQSADLQYADLQSADLRSADLRSADLRSADLRSADLRSADLRSADLQYADLRSADLRSADLRSADLRSANLRSADLQSANLQYADLQYADLQYAKNNEYAIALTRICSEGDIIGYKKCRDNIIVKLLIPKEAKRSNAFGRKCRAEFADVLEIFGSDSAYSKEDREFVYRVDKRVMPTKHFDEDFANECSTGIHFFITKVEAENY